MERRKWKTRRSTWSLLCGSGDLSVLHRATQTSRDLCRSYPRGSRILGLRAGWGLKGERRARKARKARVRSCLLPMTRGQVTIAAHFFAVQFPQERHRSAFRSRSRPWDNSIASPKHRSEEHTSELKSLMRISYDAFD